MSPVRLVVELRLRNDNYDCWQMHKRIIAELRLRDLWVAKYKSGGDRSLKQTAAMWPPRVTVKRGCNS